ncbi:MAG: TadE family protein [Planctomycetota bacterium]
MAFLIPLLVIILGATISFGLFFYQANTLQQAVDVTAQEISRMPFNATGQLGLGDLDADFSANNGLLMNDDDFKQQIYDEQYLVIADSEWTGAPFNGDFRQYADQLPLLNRLMVPLMVRDSGLGITHYPGARVNNAQTGEQTVLIPLVDYANDGTETIVEWVAPIEEITAPDGARPYAVDATSTSTSFVSGMVALRMNFPAQSTTLVNRVGNQGQTIVEADDAGLSDASPSSVYSFAVSNELGAADTQIYSGRYGLGRQAALFRSEGVRPYRKVISVQAIYRREVFQ